MLKILFFIRSEYQFFVVKGIVNLSIFLVSNSLYNLSDGINMILPKAYQCEV
jgi:hypothetical protein